MIADNPCGESVSCDGCERDGKCMIQPLKKMLDRNNGTTLNEHYGIKPNDHIQLAKDIECSMIQCENRSDVLDKWFPELDEKGRMRVVAYAEAMIRNMKSNGRL